MSRNERRVSGNVRGVTQKPFACLIEPARALALSAALVIAVIARTTFAEEGGGFPIKPVRLVNPYTPGGAVDFVARLVAQKLSESWGQPVIVDNRPGAGTNIGTEMVVRAAPDGYTLLLTSAVIATNVTLYRLPFDPVKDLQPVALVAQSPFVLAVHPAVPARNVSELIKFAKSRSTPIAFGSAGAGTTTQLMLELFKSMAKVEILHVPYKGAGPAMNALISGEVQTTFLPVTIVLPQARAGKIRALAVSSAKRVELAPELPTVSESGLAGFDPIGWYAMFAPAATPRALVERLNTAVNNATRQRELRQVLLTNGMVPFNGTAEALRDYMKSEIARWGKVIKESGIKPE